MADIKSLFPVHHSIEALPASSKIRSLYPENTFPNGAYVQLPHGKTRYWLLGPEGGTKLVLIHGLSTPAITWIEIGPYLASRGFRVLIYDLYGKGYSEAPQTTYHTSLFVSQLALLMQYIRWDSAHITGFSMGGAIAAAFAATLPHLVEGKVILMSSAGVHELPPPEESPAQKAPVKSPIPQFQELISLQYEVLPGYDYGVKSCLRDGPIHGLLWIFDKLAGCHVRSGDELQVLIIHVNRNVPSKQELD
ncbi:uncharacterized protein FIBRA_04019 [Fibroporia radiculosa]|uniref:AB hydrolase-1 domain-containing protein n=1 Tax=Fibroporia radiculosa TaxID=599839 RepID=J4I9Y0_9APHY|nr:uncharacterized protein FIBRA_04019 [Fibroporia radiculosa]CCM01946.1 predicted protein [Fibroporia radiculosa]